MGSDHPLNTIYRLVGGPFTEIYGWNLQISRHIPELLEEAGFINVNVKHNHVPLGRWHHETKMKEAGMFSQTVSEDWAAALLSRPATLGLSEEEAAQLAQKLFDANNNPTIHGYLDWIDVWAQKPPS